MSYYGDISAAAIIYIPFTTVDSGRAPIVLTGSPAISVYKDDGTGESTAGVTLSASFDSRTGLNLVKIDTSADGSFYAAGHDFSVVVTTGTVDSVSAVGYVIGSFSIEHRSVGSGTAPSAATVAAAVWNSVRASFVTSGTFGQGAASVQGNVTGSVASVTAGVTVTTNSDKTGYALSSGGVQAIWDALTSALTSVGTIGRLLVDNINATIDSRLASIGYTAPPSVAAIADQVWDEILSGHVTAGTAGKALGDAGALGSAPSAADVADAVWDEVRSGHTTSGTFGQGVSSVQGNVTGNVTGSVASVTAGVTVTTNNDKTGYALSAGGVDAIWDEVLSGHLTSGTTGEALDNAGSAGTPPTAAAIADQVWDEVRSGHTTSGTFGQGAASVQGNVTGSVATVSDLTLPTFTVVADAGNSATTFKTNRTETATDYWKDAFVTLTSGVLDGQVHRCIAYNGTTKFLTVSNGFTAAPATSVTGSLVNR